MDWNNDGKKDLITGENAGFIRIYLNTNTDASPTFGSFSYVKVGATNFDAGSYSAPWVADYNNDGLFDVICGSNTGYVNLLINSGTKGNPRFTSSPLIKNGTSILDAGTTCCPTMADWDRDGRIDLLIGESAGQVLFFRNVGNRKNPKYSGYTRLYAGGPLLDVQSYSRICPYDWDGDGGIDMLCGNRDYRGGIYPTGGVIFYKSNYTFVADQPGISAATGGKVNFSLYAKPANAGRLYIILASTSGTKPGTPISPLATLPINFDTTTSTFLLLTNTPMLANFSGKLSANGMAMARFNTFGPLPTAVVGVNLNFAYALVDGTWNFASPAARVRLVP